MNDIRNSATAPRNGVNSWRRRNASHSPMAISAVTTGTGESKAILGQLNQRRAMSGCSSAVQMLTPAMATSTATRQIAAARRFNDEIYLAAGPRRGVLLGRDFLFHIDL